MRTFPLQKIEAELASLDDLTTTITLAGETLVLTPTQLAECLPNHQVTFAQRNAILMSLINNAKSDPRWNSVLLCALMRGLRNASVCLNRQYPKQREEIETELIVGALTEAQRICGQKVRIPARIVWAARRQAISALSHNETAACVRVATPVSTIPPKPFGHPDLVLAKAVNEGVITKKDAALICATRLDGKFMTTISRECGIAKPALYKKRERAEARLVSWLREKI